MKTKQDYGTPWEFIRAIEGRFGPVVCDLAASAHNAKCDAYYDQERNSLEVDWRTEHPDGLLWLNPPFADIEPWAAKCSSATLCGNGFIAMLTPASIGSQWFATYVHRRAMVFGLSPRMTFDGTPPNPRTGKLDPYPKDLMLSVFGHGMNGFDVWRWK